MDGPEEENRNRICHRLVELNDTLLKFSLSLQHIFNKKNALLIGFDFQKTNCPF